MSSLDGNMNVTFADVFRLERMPLHGIRSV